MLKLLLRLRRKKMATIKICDKCGSTEGKFVIILPSCGEIDLCIDCYSRLFEWLPEEEERIVENV